MGKFGPRDETLAVEPEDTGLYKEYWDRLKAAQETIRRKEFGFNKSGVGISYFSLLAESGRIATGKADGWVYRRPKDISEETILEAPMMWRISLNVKSSPELIAALDRIVSDKNTPDSLRGYYKVPESFAEWETREDPVTLFVFFNPEDEGLSPDEKRKIREENKERLRQIVGKNISKFVRDPSLSVGEPLFPGAALVLEPELEDMQAELKRAEVLDAQLKNKNHELERAVRTYFTRTKNAASKMEASPSMLKAVQNVLGAETVPGTPSGDGRGRSEVRSNVRSIFDDLKETLNGAGDTRAQDPTENTVMGYSANNIFIKNDLISKYGVKWISYIDRPGGDFISVGISRSKEQDLGVDAIYIAGDSIILLKTDFKGQKIFSKIGVLHAVVKTENKRLRFVVSDTNYSSLISDEEFRPFIEQWFIKESDLGLSGGDGRHARFEVRSEVGLDQDSLSAVDWQFKEANKFWWDMGVIGSRMPTTKYLNPDQFYAERAGKIAFSHGRFIPGYSFHIQADSAEYALERIETSPLSLDKGLFAAGITYSSSRQQGYVYAFLFANVGTRREDLVSDVVVKTYPTARGNGFAEKLASRFGASLPPAITKLEAEVVNFETLKAIARKIAVLDHALVSRKKIPEMILSGNDAGFRSTLAELLSENPRFLPEVDDVLLKQTTVGKMLTTAGFEKFQIEARPSEQAPHEMQIFILADRKKMEMVISRSEMRTEWKELPGHLQLLKSDNLELRIRGLEGIRMGLAKRSGEDYSDLFTTLGQFYDEKSNSDQVRKMVIDIMAGEGGFRNSVVLNFFEEQLQKTHSTVTLIHLIRRLYGYQGSGYGLTYEQQSRFAPHVLLHVYSKDLELVEKAAVYFLRWSVVEIAEGQVARNQVGSVYYAYGFQGMSAADMRLQKRLQELALQNDNLQTKNAVITLMKETGFSIPEGLSEIKPVNTLPESHIGEAAQVRMSLSQAADPLDYLQGVLRDGNKQVIFLGTSLGDSLTHLGPVLEQLAAEGDITHIALPFPPETGEKFEQYLKGDIEPWEWRYNPLGFEQSAYKDDLKSAFQKRPNDFTEARQVYGSLLGRVKFVYYGAPDDLEGEFGVQQRALNLLNVVRQKQGRRVRMVVMGDSVSMSKKSGQGLFDLFDFSVAEAVLDAWPQGRAASLHSMTAGAAYTIRQDSLTLRELLPRGKSAVGFDIEGPLSVFKDDSYNQRSLADLWDGVIVWDMGGDDRDHRDDKPVGESPDPYTSADEDRLVDSLARSEVRIEQQLLRDLKTWVEAPREVKYGYGKRGSSARPNKRGGRLLNLAAGELKGSHLLLPTMQNKTSLGAAELRLAVEKTGYTEEAFCCTAAMPVFGSEKKDHTRLWNFETAAGPLGYDINDAIISTRINDLLTPKMTWGQPTVLFMDIREDMLLTGPNGTDLLQTLSEKLQPYSISIVAFIRPRNSVSALLANQQGVGYYVEVPRVEDVVFERMGNPNMIRPVYPVIRTAQGIAWGRLREKFEEDAGLLRIDFRTPVGEIQDASTWKPTVQNHERRYSSFSDELADILAGERLSDLREDDFIDVLTSIRTFFKTDFALLLLEYFGRRYGLFETDLQFAQIYDVLNYSTLPAITLFQSKPWQANVDIDYLMNVLSKSDSSQDFEEMWPLLGLILKRHIEAVSRSEVRGIPETLVSRMAAVFKPDEENGASLNRSEVRVIYEVVLRGDREALIAALKDVVERRTAPIVNDRFQGAVPNGASTEARVAAIKAHQAKIERAIKKSRRASSADTDDGMISIALMLDASDNHSFLSQFVTVLQESHRKVEVIAKPDLLNNELLKQAGTDSLQKRSVGKKGFGESVMAMGVNSQIPLGFDPRSRGEEMLFANGFQPLSTNMDGIAPEDTLMRDHIEWLLAVSLVRIAEITSDSKHDEFLQEQRDRLIKAHKDPKVFEKALKMAKAEYLRTQLEETFGIQAMFKADQEGVLSLMGSAVQDYIIRAEVQKSA